MKRAGELALVLAVAAASFLPFIGKAFHVDEPLFLSVARQIVKDPLNPYAFTFSWFGRTEPMRAINNTPPAFLYLLAGGIKLVGENETALRLIFLPLDLASAAALYLIAAQLLKNPIWPVLAVLLSPAWMIGLNLLYPEKLSMALGLWGLYGILTQKRWSAILLGIAALAKFAALAFLAPALVYGWSKGWKPKALAGYAAIAIAPLAIYLAFDRASAPALLTTTIWGAGSAWSSWPHKLRSLTAFTGGAALAAIPWIFLQKRKALLASAAIAAALFLPPLDGEPVRAIDRITGIILAVGGFAGILAAVRAGPFLGSWALAGAGVLIAYWSVTARLAAFLAPPVVIALALAAEKSLNDRKRRALYAAGVCAAAALSLALAVVDHRFAAGKRWFAEQAIQEVPQGLRFTGNWGFQLYLERAGVRPLERDWSDARPGETVAMTAVNSNLPMPARLAEGARRLRVDSSVPLRLISGWNGQGGFYSSASGFLPFSLSREPLDEYWLVSVSEPSR